LPENKESDETRTLWFGMKGFKVVRFNNEEIINKTEDVLNKIITSLNNQPSIKDSNDLSSSAAAETGAGTDFIGAFAVSVFGARKWVEKFAAEHDEYNKIMVQILADRLVEAFAECLHEKTRKEYWGYAKEETLSNEELIKENYKGIRPAPGYPACPDHTEKIKLFDLLNAQENIGVELTENLAMNPPLQFAVVYCSSAKSLFWCREDHAGSIGRFCKEKRNEY
jgi:5-methyltetrahydrofolate--homocysteine methyltransferase